jgi:predicted aspartyl protease
MGQVYVTIGVGNHEGGDFIEVEALVDTGATHTSLPESLLDQLHIDRRGSRFFNSAAGTPISLDMGQAWFAYGDEKWICPVIFGREGLYLMGATTLEAFDLVVDPGGNQLVPATHLKRPF